MTVSGTITCPPKPDLSTRTYGDAFTPDDLYYLRFRDDKAGFLVEVMDDDAFRNGPVYKTPADEERGKPFWTMFKEGWKQARTFGWTLVVHLDSTTENLNVGIDQSIAIQIFHPYVTSVGGVTRWTTKKKIVTDEDGVETEVDTGIPETFYIKPTPQSVHEVKVSADRCDIWTNGVGNWWQGYTALGRSYDDIVALRLWRGTSMRRMRDYATIRYLIQFINQGANVDIPASVRADIKTAMGDVPHALMPGEVKVDAVGGPVQPEELGITTDASAKGAAVGGGITAATMTGGEAGQKLSVDSNDTTYALEIEDIQEDALPHFTKTFERLGVNITGLRSAAHIPTEKKYETLGKLLMTYQLAPPSAKEAVGELVSNYMASEFNIEMQLDAEADMEAAAAEEEGKQGMEGEKKPDKKPEKGGKKKWWKKG